MNLVVTVVKAPRGQVNAWSGHYVLSTPDICDWGPGVGRDPETYVGLVKALESSNCF